MLTRPLHLSGQCAILFKVFASLLYNSTKINNFRPIQPIFPFNTFTFPPYVTSLIGMQKICLIIIIVVAVISRSEL